MVKEKYFFGGNDDFSVERYARDVFESIENVDAEIITSSATKISEAIDEIKKVCEAIDTVSIFQQQKKIWYRGVGFFNDSQIGRSAEIESWIEQLQQTLSNSSDDFFILSAAPIDKRMKHVKWFTANCVSQISEKPKSRECIEYAKSLATKNKIRFEPEALEKFIDLCGDDLSIIHSEFHKLALYCTGQNYIAREDVVAIVIDSREGDFFEPIDTFFNHNREKFQKVLNKYFAYYQEGRPLIAALQNRTRVLIQLKNLIDGEYLKSGSISKENLFNAYKSLQDNLDAYEGSIFAQNPWYLNKLSLTISKISLEKLINLQQELYLSIPKLTENIIPQSKILLRLYDQLHNDL